MRLLTRFLAPRAATPGPDSDYWYQPVGGLTLAGITVTKDAALKLSAAWRCTSILTGSVAMLPLPVYQRRRDGGKERATNHPLYALLHDRPNAWQTSHEWRELLMHHLLWRGNAYSRIVKGPRGPVDQLVPMHPDAVTPEQQRDGSIKYRVRMQDGQTQTLYDDEVFHLRGLSDDGVTGLDVITHAAQTMGIGLAQERFAGQFFAQSPAPGAVAEHPGQLGKEATERLRDQMAKRATGANQQKLLVLEEGMKFTQMQVGLTAEQAQLIQARETSAEDVCRWFGVPPHMAGLTAKSTSWGTGIEQQSIGYVVYTLLPWLRKWEARISHDLILAPDTYYAEFIVDALLRGDAKSRAETLQIWRRNGIVNADEWRAMENLNAIPDGAGEIYTIEANMTRLEQVGEPAPSGMAPGRNGASSAYEPALNGRNGVNHA